jgi:predicted metal-dependent hydrolase
MFIFEFEAKCPLAASWLSMGLLMKLDWTEGELGEGLRCYRAEEFFSAHEHWEVVWLASKEPEKTFLQGLIQVAAAFHHLQRGNLRGTRSLLRRARSRLTPYPESFGGINVISLVKEIDEWLHRLEASNASHGLPYPGIHYDGRRARAK